MMRNFTACLALLLFSVTFLSAQTSIEGKVTDAETGEPIIFGNVALYKNDVLITGTETDLDGNYSIPNIDPGTYDVEASYIGYTAQRQAGVVIFAGKAIRLDFELGTGVILDEVVITDYEDDMDAAGYIGIQHHGEKGQTYRFRNLRIKEL